MKFKNPINEHIEEKSVPWLWCLLFGAFYFLVSGIFTHVVIILVLTCTLFALFGVLPATLIVIFMHLYYSSVANPIVRNHYLRKGWQEVTEKSEVARGYDGLDEHIPNNVANPEDKICPFCAEKIKYAAIKCKHCGSNIDPKSA